MNTTLAVLEKFIPRFFAGATDIYNNEIKRFHNINKNNFKPPVSEEVKRLVRQNFSRELEFYKFCKQRLHTQFLAASLMDQK
jgi:dermatan/chondrotin sulfate uronyl 2-O-sulfotransferase UST